MIILNEPVTAKQFSLYRFIFGTYLFCHFASIFQDAHELFSNVGILPIASHLPSYGKLPITLFYFDSQQFVMMFMTSLMVASLFIALGMYRRIASAWMLYGWICLYNRNPFIANPSLAYIGWILITFILIGNETKTGWKFPKVIYYGYWFITAISYTVSGLHKLQAPSWVDGSALMHVLTGPLARQNFLVDMAISMPSLTRFMTWVSLTAEIMFLFMGLFKRIRKYYFLLILMFHVGILSTINFTDLTFGMIVAHLYLYDARWIGMTVQNIKKTKAVVRDLGVKIAETGAIGVSSTMSIWLLKAYGVFCTIVLTATYIGYDTIENIANITIDSLWGFAFIIGGLFSIMALERIIPDIKLADSPGWWRWVLCINIFQLFSVVLASYTWDSWLCDTSYYTSMTGFHLRDYVSPFVGGLIAYVINQWFFYWWHLLRHEVYFLWITCHQFHHSAKRLEAITSFYKHPIEILVDAQLMSVLVYAVLGLSRDSNIWLTIFSAYGEFFYHMNIKTPQVIGYFFQRPESHRVHHERNRRSGSKNYSDFPFFDWLNETLDNPREMTRPTGFDNEHLRMDMLCFADVVYKFRHDAKGIGRAVIMYSIVLWGLFCSMAFLVHRPAPAANFLVSSPYPIVFSTYNGVETFSLTWDICTRNNTGVTCTDLTKEMYDTIRGSYARRNVYGAVFCYGAMFNTTVLTTLRDDVLRYAVCDPGHVAHDLGFSNVDDVTIRARSHTVGNEHLELSMQITC